MNIAELFVRNRVASCMLSGAIALFGLIGIASVGLGKLPNIDVPLITIATVHPGASPEAVDSSITGVIESAVNTVSGIDYLESSSLPGYSLVRVKFKTGLDPDIAFNEIQSKVNQIANRLPREAQTPVIAKLDVNATPVVWVVLRGDRSQEQMHAIARHHIKRQLETINGVGQVAFGGGMERKIQIKLDLVRLSSFNMTVSDVIAAISRQHAQRPGGFIATGDDERMLHLDMEHHSIEALRGLLLNQGSNGRITLGDVAQVSDGLDDERTQVSYDGESVIAIAVQKLPNANTVLVVREVERRLKDSVQPSLPAGIRAELAINEADVIGETVLALRDHLTTGLLLAILVVWFFVLNIRSTLIVAIAIPISLLGAVVVMYFNNYSFNIMSMSALLLLIGVVVDDAIVVVENIHRKFEAGEQNADTAAIEGTTEVVAPVVAASLTLVCIFSTVVFMEGMAGIFLRSFAVITTVGVLVSLFISLSLTPALGAILLRPEGQRSGVIRFIDKFHGWVEHLYRLGLIIAIRNRLFILLVTLTLVGASFWLMTRMGTEFIPADDESRLQVKVKAPAGSSLDYMKRKVGQVEFVLASHVEVKHFLTTIGDVNQGNVNEALISVILTPKQERQVGQQLIMSELTTALRKVAGVESYVNAFPILNGLRAETMELHLSGTNLHAVAEVAQMLHERMRSIPELGDVELSLKLNQPMVSVSIDRERAARLGLSVAAIGETLSLLSAGIDVAYFNDLPSDGERYDVHLSADKGSFNLSEGFEKVYLRNATGGLIRLDTVAGIEETYGPSIINRRNLAYSAAFYSTPTVSLGEALALVDELAVDVLPPGYELRPGGQADELEKTVYYITFVFLTGMLMVYMVLASQFNSLLQPLLVMLAQPLAIIGGVAALWVAGHTLNIYSMIGLVLLVGLVSKNSILLIDRINNRRLAGMGTHEAILEACPLRLRPVLMTSLTVVLAMLPAALGHGPGSGQYGPLAVAVLGGVISSTLLTLFVVPVAYSLLEQWLVVRRT
ncbi:MAG TPA: AcrB/AcrD/AcrF family protein [Spongiibacteraceae bacterium]|nr:acriflavin resistance protein [Spongiibacteraceae bacterium]HCS28008.1 AcrB/AcrD/AcrF family protein [Spongiibacteraceae bacterium]